MSTFKEYIADGSTALFAIPFPYLDQNHVGVSLNGFPMSLGAHYEYVNGSAIRFRPHVAPVANGLVKLQRETPIHQLLVQFQNGATLTQDDLNTAALQSLYSIEELWDRYEARFDAAAVRLSNGQFTDAQNLIDAAVADVLNSSLLADLQSRISDIDTNAEVILEQTARLNEVQGVIDTLLEIDGVGIATYIQNVEQSLTTDIDAIAAHVSLLGAEANGGTSFMLDLNSVYVGPGESFASRLSTISTEIDGNTASISTQQSVLNGLAAQWMVKTDVNGHVAGFGLYNNGATSQFIVSASTFAVSNGATVKTPFVITGGVCYMQNVVVQNALIENLTVGKLTSGTITATITQNADINVGTGRIVYDNGTVMRVSGTGFGNANQFIDWFGPKMTISLCSEANAITYLKTNGDAYFGGSLSAGPLQNGGQSSGLSSTEQFTLGPIGTNGNPITVVFSYSGSFSGWLAGNTEGQSFPNSGNLAVYRTIAGQAETLVVNIPLSGTCSHSLYNGEPATPNYDRTLTNSSLGGSLTYTDSAGGTQDRTYRAVLTARSMHHGPTTQRVSINTQE